MKVTFCLCLIGLYVSSVFSVRSWYVSNKKRKLEKMDLFFILTPIVNTLVVILIVFGHTKRFFIFYKNKFIKWFMNA